MYGACFGTNSFNLVHAINRNATWWVITIIVSCLIVQFVAYAIYLRALPKRYTVEEFILAHNTVDDFIQARKKGLRDED